MTPSLLRQLWSLVEATQATLLLQLDDSMLAQWLMRELQQEAHLTHGDRMVVHDYIQTKLPLIRDLAHDRLVSTI